MGGAEYDDFGKLAINHKNLGEIIKIEEGRDVLFVNDSKLSAYEAIEQLNLNYS